MTGGQTNFSWEFGDGQTSTGIEPEHPYSNAGTYTVKLIGNAPIGCGVDSAESTIYVNETPQASFSASNVCDGTPVAFSNQSSIKNGNLSYAWRFGDDSTSMQASPNYLYERYGSYNVQLEAISDSGCVDTAFNTVAVNEVPTADFKVQNVCEGDSVEFMNQSSINTTELTYAWNFGDGNASSAQ
ncbi:MAG: hypothetical protein BRD49_01070, partial [Bacteroidetes bacterium SW_10_40_5]